MSSESSFEQLHARIRNALRRDSALTRREKIGWLVLAAVFLVGPFASHLHKAFHEGRPHGDWYSIYSIAQYSAETGELEADERDPVVRTQRYPPITRPMLMLLAIPTKSASAVLSFALFVGLYLWSAIHVARLFLAPNPGAMWFAVFLAIGLVVPYVWADLTAGNLTSVLLASATGAYVLAPRRPVSAGVVLSIGIMLKMVPLLCLGYFILRKKWRVVWGVCVGVIGLGLVPSLVIFGSEKLWDYHEYWYRTQFSQFTPLKTIDNPVECTYQNQAVVRTMIRLFTPTSAGSSSDPFFLTIAEPPRIILKVAYFAIMSLSAAAVVAWLWRHREDESQHGAAAGYALCVGAMLWFSPWVGSYYFPLAMWAAVALLAQTINLDGRFVLQARWSHRALLFWLIAMPAIASQFLRATGIHTLATGVLLVVLALTVSRERSDIGESQRAGQESNPQPSV